MVDLLHRAITPHTEEIERLGPGNILLVVYQPAQRARAVLEAIGAPDAPVFVLGERQRRQLAKADYITERWVSEPPAPDCLKIMLISGAGSLLVNYQGGSGWSIEQGSTSNAALN